MINALNGLGHSQLEYARWAPQAYDNYKFIRVELVSENEKHWSTVIQNLITVADSTIIRTASVYDYAPRQHIMFRNRWYEIRAVTEITQDVAPQSLALTNGGNRQFVMELIEVNGYDAE